MSAAPITSASPVMPNAALIGCSAWLGRALVACEYSGAVRDAFAKLGWYALSCDLLPTDNPGNHHQGDVRDLLAQPWDIIIAFPPCTYLCSSGMHWTVRGLRDPKLTEDALDFVRCLLGAPCKHIALENPVGAISTRIRKPDCIIHPWQFGHPESKTTCLWLKNLPALVPTNVLQKPASGRWENQCASGQNKLAPSPDRWKERSKTYQGIADAMASQWSAYVLSAPPTVNHAPIAESLFAWSANNTTPTAPVSDLETPTNSDTMSSKKTGSSTEYVNVEPDPYILALALSRTMKTQIKKVTIEGRKVWQWRIMDGRRIAYGGLCATKRDAANDAGIVLRDALATRSQRAPTYASATGLLTLPNQPAARKARSLHAMVRHLWPS